ncbi:unnamed protein product, partial [Mesorhabditis belari]|uniref:Uncharacterized protein n=1 Tax=Mesorhabditis belari TaxID=2138241 RepID=A0AAF3FQF8_9BILA
MILRFFLFGSIFFQTVHLWNEDDETQRIQMIMDEEKRYYDDELKPATQMKYKQSSVYGGVSRQYDLKRRQPEPTYDYDMAVQQPKAEALRGEKSRSKYAEQDEMDGGNWCYSCATPLGMLSPEMQTSVRNFLDVRRTEYPRDKINRECAEGKNVSKIVREKCLHRYCQTLVLTDHNQGASFVLRGCAENFGAVNVKQFEQLEENHCKSLHKNLDMRECICKNRHFCFSGSSRRRGSNSSKFLFLPLTAFTYLCLTRFL